jgi:hypothetical protein
VALVATNVAQPLDNPATGLIVYNTATSGTAPYQVAPGLYYNAGTPQVANWVPVGDGSSAAERNHGPATSCGTNTTYGGTVQGAATANCTSAPSGTDNTGFGTDVFGTTTKPTASDNTGVGYQALEGVTSASQNTAVGSTALQSVTSGFNNTAVGFEAGQLITGANDDIAIGNGALSNTASGDNNVAVGDISLINVTGSDNVGVGYNTLSSLTTGSNNTAVGYNANVSANNLTNATAIGNGASATASNEFVAGNSSVTKSWVQVDWTIGSDARIKKNVQENVPGLAFINSLRPVTYNYDLDKENQLMGVKNTPNSPGKYDVEKITFSGFIAQEVDASAKN